jgi:hypothetical protein
MADVLIHLLKPDVITITAIVITIIRLLSQQEVTHHLHPAAVHPVEVHQEAAVFQGLHVNGYCIIFDDFCYKAGFVESIDRINRKLP